MTHIAGRGGYPVTAGGRWLLAGWSLFLLGGFALAFSLTPNPRGFGTHESLGLPPCTFRLLFKIPCPSCGMTTCFSHLTHGNLIPAIRANAGGVLLAAVCAAQVPWCWWSAYRGRLAGVSDPGRFLACLMGGIAGVCLVNWIVQFVL